MENSETKGIGYVYLTTNLLNGKQYVGQHLSNCFDTTYKGSGTYIKRAIDKYGWDNFSCEIICWCSTQTQLNEAEDNYIKLLNTMFPKGYNLKGGGSHGKYSEEAKKNNSKSCKKYWECKENRKKASEAMKKYYANEETRKKLSEAMKKYFESEEARKKNSEAQKGKHLTEETRKKMSEERKKYYESEEARKKASEAHKKYFANEENRKKMSESLLNSPKAQKRRKKVSQFTKEDVFVKEWCSVMEIERVLGYDRRNISSCCLGKIKTAYKYIWRYAENDEL